MPKLFGGRGRSVTDEVRRVGAVTSQDREAVRTMALLWYHGVPTCKGCVKTPVPHC